MKQTPILKGAVRHLTIYWTMLDLINVHSIKDSTANALPETPSEGCWHISGVVSPAKCVNEYCSLHAHVHKQIHVHVDNINFIHVHLNGDNQAGYKVPPCIYTCLGIRRSGYINVLKQAPYLYCNLRDLHRRNLWEKRIK